MKRINQLVAKGIVVIAAAASVVACSSDLSRNAAPVQLVVTNTQVLNKIDLVGGTGCDQNVGTIKMSTIVKNSASADDRFNDVRITRYRVSYIRTDGGKLVPASFVRSIDSLITANGTGSLTSFLIFQSDAINQAPFASLLATNGGRDPETGRTRVSMDVIVEVFGETLAGEAVSGSTRFPLDFCINCGGCS